MREYEIYHDESKDGGYWHAFLFIPVDRKQLLIDYLKKFKNDINANVKDISFKGVSLKAKKNHDKPRIIRYWISFCVAALQQQKCVQFPPCYYSLKNKIEKLNQLIGAKLVILRIDNNHNDMFEHMDNLSRIETTMRMGMKGGLHGLFFEDEKIIINQFYIDGNEHYIGCYGRDLDNDNILKRLSVELKENILFKDNCEIFPVAKKDYDSNNSERLLIQLTDLMLGAIKFMNTNNDFKSIRYWMSGSLSTLLDRDQNNYVRMKESRFFKGFLISGAKIIDGIWNFYPLENKKLIPKGKQVSFL